MSGHISGVQARIKEKVPGLLYTHCVAHILELAILDSIKFDDSYLEKFNDNINGIFKFYYLSAVRRQELKHISEMFEEEFKKLGLLKNIRWIASRARALNLIEANYKIIVYDLEQKSYVRSETGKKALGYVKFMKQPKFIFYLHFLQDLVETLKPISLKFQRDDLLACEIPRIISGASSCIESLSITDGANLSRLMLIMKLHPDRSYDLLYKDVILDKPVGRRDAEIEHNAESYHSYYMEHCFETIVTGAQDFLASRYSAFKKTPLKEMVKIFDFKGWPKSFKEEKRWGLQEVKDLAEFYHSYNLISVEEKNLAPCHWIPFRTKVIKFRNDQIIDVYVDMLRERDHELKGMLVLTEIMMTVSASTASCERGFSCMNKQKTNLRTTLSHSSLDDIMRICIDGKKIQDFEAGRHVDNWMSTTKGVRHVEGHEPPKKKVKSTNDTEGDGDTVSFLV